ncbi:hypothetical protein [Romboutsia sp.]|uniref:hypothetical protein n=1 Tax=Romboutsia sp. TaxID=1965302 RepID=UPI002BA241A1|nr:hypothetical protein [Romboutsia sp.]HSQ87720.1 hypothetical protein [Romboutsia sp.]
MPKYNDEQLTQNIINMLKEKLTKDYSPGSTKRDAHPKCLGLLKAYFIVARDLPKEYQVGIFKEPKTYSAFIRVSNSNPKINSDKIKDFRGFSIKLLGVNGPKCTKDEKYTQDFLFINNETMPLGTLNLFHDAIYYTTKSNPIIFGVKLLLNGKIGILKDITKNQKHDTSPLDIKYFSTTPYMFGNKKVKYSLVPRSIYQSQLPKEMTPTYLTNNMQKHLQSHEAIFDFMVQFQTTEKAMPTNDASIKWNEDKSPFIKLAQIKIPIQEFTTKEREELAEILSFSPGHALTSHRPIGDINIARIKIYEEMSKFRHFRNKEKLFEPDERYFNNID